MGALKVWDGTTWQYVLPAPSASVQSSAPASPATGQLWYDSTYDIMKVWTGTAWDVYGYGPAMKAKATITASSAAFSAQTVLLSAPAITVDGNTEIEIAWNWYNFTHTVATDTFISYLYDGAVAGSGTLLAEALQTIAANSHGGYLRYRYTPAAGSHTFTARSARSAGTGTATLVATTGVPSQLTVNPV